MEALKSYGKGGEAVTAKTTCTSVRKFRWRGLEPIVDEKASGKKSETNRTLFERLGMVKDERERMALEEALLKNNDGLVWSIVKPIDLSTLEGITLSELIDEGRLALLNAMRRFDPAMGNEFSTYATKYVRGKIFNFIRDHGYLAHVPVYIKDGIQSIAKAEEKLGREEKEVSVQALCEKTGIKKKPLLEMLRVRPSLRTEPLTGVRLQNIEDGSTLQVSDYIADPYAPSPEAIVCANGTLETLREVVYSYRFRNEVQKRIVIKRMERKLEGEKSAGRNEIGAEEGIGGERVRQIIKYVLQTGLAHALEKKGIGEEEWMAIFVSRRSTDQSASKGDKKSGKSGPGKETEIRGLHGQTSKALELVDKLFEEDLTRGIVRDRVLGQDVAEISQKYTGGDAEAAKKCLEESCGQKLIDAGLEQGMNFFEIITHNTQCVRKARDKRQADGRASA